MRHHRSQRTMVVDIHAEAETRPHDRAFHTGHNQSCSHAMRHRLANASGDQHIAPAIAPATLRCLNSSCLHADIGPLESASLATR
eukprot:6321633-Prymnesium_polylepis.1